MRNTGWAEVAERAATAPTAQRGTVPHQHALASALGAQVAALRAASGAGSGNYSFTVPVASYPGRGDSALDLTLTYNSRIWQKVPTATPRERMVYDIDNDWPAPGWRFPFERVVVTQEEPVLVGVDGARHPARVTAADNSSGVHITDQITTDGSLIALHHEQGPATRLAWANYPDGRRVEFTALSDDGRTLYPTGYIDRHGNLTTLTYRAGTGPAIDIITDSVGRQLRFLYDPAGRLTGIRGPGCHTGGDIMLLRLHHSSVTPHTAWDPQLSVDAPGALPVIDALMTPPTGRGHWFADPGDYNGYGMLREVRECAAMTWTADPAAPQDQGRMTRGTPIQTRSYLYPADAGAQQSGSPDFTEMVHTFAGQDTVPERTRFAVAPFGTEGTQVTITHADGSKTVQQSQTAAGAPGMLAHTATYDAANLLMRATDVQWEPGGGDSPRVRCTVSTTPVGAARTDFLYGPVNNQVQERIEHHPDGSVARRTVTTFDNISARYAERHLLNVPTGVQVFDGDGSPLSHVTLINDTGDLHPTPGITRLAARFDPTNPGYDPATRARALPSHVLRYLDPAGPPGSETELRVLTYDLAGNLVASDGPRWIATTYDATTNYALPTAQVTGAKDPASPHRLSTAATYNPAGRLASTTDVSGTVTSYTYTEDGFRPVLTYHPQEPAFEERTTYDDATLQQNTVLLDGAGEVAATTVRTVDGLGRVRKTERANADGGWDVTEFHADALGATRRTTAPYRAGDPVVFGTSYHDPLGRVVRQVAPDGSVTAWAYDGPAPGPFHNSGTFHTTTRVTNAWGWERWNATDTLGRLRAVAEPVPDGDGTVLPGRPTVNTDVWHVGLTTAVYANLGPPGANTAHHQVRRVRTDGLGRVVAQELPERKSTLRTPHIPNSGRWTDLFTYDTRGNLATHTDARGVVTSYYYDGDPLDRLQRLICDAATLTDLGHPLAYHPFGRLRWPFSEEKSLEFTFTYETTGDLRRVATQSAADLLESYTYDAVGVRTASVTWTAIPNGPLVTEHKHGPLGRVTHLTYPTQWRQPEEPRPVQEYVYGVGSAVTDVLLDGQQMAGGGHYDAAGRLRTVTVGPPGPGQTVEDYAWDPWHGWLDHQSVTRDGAVLLDLWYDRARRGPPPLPGMAGPITAITNAVAPATTTTYLYDHRGRLREAAHGPATATTADWILSYGYDVYGNRTQTGAAGTDAQGNPMRPDGQAMPTDPFTNRISAGGWEYDAAGNPTVRPHPETGEPFRYAYDAAGRLATISDGAGSVVLEHLYGVCHRRRGTWYADTDETVLYAWDGDTVIAEYLAEGPAPQREERGVDGKPRWSRGEHFLANRTVRTVRAGQPALHLHPGLTGTRLVTPADGPPEPDRPVSWLPFGSRQVDSAAADLDGGAGFGGYGAVDHGLAYAQHRFYDPSAGRFLTPDPLGAAGVLPGGPASSNAYSYVSGDPVTNVDPLGLFEVCSREGGCWDRQPEPPVMTSEVHGYRDFAAPDRPEQTPQWRGTPWAAPSGGERVRLDPLPKCKRPTGPPHVPPVSAVAEWAQRHGQDVADASQYHSVGEVFWDVVAVGAAGQSVKQGTAIVIGLAAGKSLSAWQTVKSALAAPWRLGWGVGTLYGRGIERSMDAGFFPIDYSEASASRYADSIARAQFRAAELAVKAAAKSEECW